MNRCGKSALKSWEISGALLNSGDYKGNVVPPPIPSPSHFAGKVLPCPFQHIHNTGHFPLLHNQPIEI